MKKLILLMLVILLVLPLISAQEVYPVNKDVDLKFLCTLNSEIPTASATYNFTISYPNGTTFIDNKQATALGQGAFNYTTFFSEIGIYKVQSFCYDSSYSYSNTEEIQVTTTGIIQTSILNNSLFIILGALGLILVIFGAAKGIPWFGFIGAIMFLLIGIYTMIYGFNNITNLYTRGVAVTLLGMGFIFMFAAAYEWLYTEDNN